jgi:hypothetical protein
MKLKRGTFTAIFFLACIAALELEQVVLEEIRSGRRPELERGRQHTLAILFQVEHDART